MNKYIVWRNNGEVKEYWTGTKWTDSIKYAKIFTRMPNRNRYKKFIIEKINEESIAEKIEETIKETLTITNKKSIKYAVKKILQLFENNDI